MTPDKIHVAIIRYNLADDYNRHTGATMASVMENCSVPVVFHILHEEKVSFQNRKAAEENIKKYHELVGRYSCDVEFHNVVLPEWITDENIPGMKKFGGIGTGFYRFYYSYFLPNEKIVSLGSDVIVETDLKDFVEYLPNEYSIAGVRDIGMFNKKQIHQYYRDTDMDFNKYVNADVLIMNMKKINENKILPKKALDHLKKYPTVPYLEQDIFNGLFSKDMFLLDQRWNLYASNPEVVDKEFMRLNGDLKDGYIFHYAGAAKPWDKYVSKYDMRYHYYSSLTPWGDSGKAFDLIPQLTTVDEFISNIDYYIWQYQIMDKIKYLWKLTIPTYIKLIKHYLHDFGIL